MYQTVRYVVEKFRLSFRMGKTECKLVKSILAAHGFREVSEFYWQIYTLWCSTYNTIQ